MQPWGPLLRAFKCRPCRDGDHDRCLDADGKARVSCQCDDRACAARRTGG